MENKYIEIEGFASAKATGFGFSRLRFDAPSIVVLLWSSLVLPSTRPTHTSIATTNDADLVHGNIMHQWWPIPSNSTTLWRGCCCANTQTAAAADSYIQCGGVRCECARTAESNRIRSWLTLNARAGAFFFIWFIPVGYITTLIIRETKKVYKGGNRLGNNGK